MAQPAVPFNGLSLYYLMFTELPPLQVSQVEKLYTLCSDLIAVRSLSIQGGDSCADDQLLLLGAQGQFYQRGHFVEIGYPTI